MHYKSLLIGVACFAAGWSMANLTQNPAVMTARSHVSEMPQPQTVVLYSDSREREQMQRTALSISPDEQNEPDSPHSQHAQNDEQADGLAMKSQIAGLLAKLAINFDDRTLNEYIENGSIYHHIEEGLTQLPLSDERRMPMIVEYLDTFHEQVGEQFAANLLYETQYQPIQSQQQILQVIQGFSNTAYESGNHAPLARIVEHLSLYQSSSDAKVRLGALEILDSAIDDITELKIKIAPFMDDAAPEVRYRAQSIMSAIDID